MPLIESPTNQMRRCNAQMAKSIRTANGYIQAWRKRALEAEDENEDAWHEVRRLRARIHFREAVIRGLMQQRNAALRHIYRHMDIDPDKMLSTINNHGDSGFNEYLQEKGFRETDGEGNIYVNKPYRISSVHPQTRVDRSVLK